MRRMVDDKEMITIDSRITALEQGGGGGGDAYTKAQTDALLLAKLDINKHFDDDDNPEDFYIKQPETYSSGIELHASRDDNHHPDYANLLMTPTHVVMMANSANHGDNDDDYTGSIEVTDGHVTLDVTDGENTTTLQIGANSAKLNNVQIATTNDITTYTAGTGINITNNEISIDNTVALKTDIPTYTGGSGISISGNTIAADSTLARVADIPVITGLVMYNYKITISGLDNGTSPTRSAVYIVSLPYQWDYSSLTKYDIIRLVPVWSVVVDTDTSSGNKNIGRFHWQTGTIALIDWVDGTHTVMNLTGGFDATIEAAAPAHW